MVRFLRLLPTALLLPLLLIFIVEAVALGFLLRYGKLHKWLNTAIAIVMLIGAIVLGLYFPMYISQMHLAHYCIYLCAHCIRGSRVGTAPAP